MSSERPDCLMAVWNRPVGEVCCIRQGGHPESLRSAHVNNIRSGAVLK